MVKSLTNGKNYAILHWFEARAASAVAYDPLAQAVEHLTFNQGVRGSIPRWLTILYRQLGEFFVVAQD